MNYKGRAFFNLLKMNVKHHPSLPVRKWQVEDYRKLSLEELFKRLQALHVVLDQDQFLLFTKEYDNPEDLAECLCVGDDAQTFGKIYLVVFELWRRLCPEKQSLSIFCDELDLLIENYENNTLKNEEELQKSFVTLQDILDGSLDAGNKPLEAVSFISTYLCHDLERFLYEYIAYQVDLENDLFASELLEGFYIHVKNKRWFDLLRIRLVIATDLQEGNKMMRRLLEQLDEQVDLPLLFEILHFLIHLEENDLFILTFNQTLSHIEVEEDFQEILAIVGDYFNCVEKEEEEKRVQVILETRKNNNPSEKFHKNCQVLKEIKTMVEASLISQDSNRGKL